MGQCELFGARVVQKSRASDLHVPNRFGELIGAVQGLRPWCRKVVAISGLGLDVAPSRDADHISDALPSTSEMIPLGEYTHRFGD